MRRSPIVPIPGDGKYRRQPIHVEDFCRAGLALINGGLKRQALDAGGGDALSMNDLVRTLGKAMGRDPRILRLPSVFHTLAGRFRPELDPELLSVFDTDDVADPAAMTAATGVVPRCFAAGAGDLGI